MTGSEPTPREAARVIVHDTRGRILLLNGADTFVPEVRYWFTPGGGLDPGETYESAARRELLEEVGLTATDLGGVVFEDAGEFSFEGVRYLQHQCFFAVDLDEPGSEIRVDTGRWTDYERRSMTHWDWWRLDDLSTTAERYYPLSLVEVVRSVAHWGTAKIAR